MPQFQGGSGDIQNAARVGKARALLNLGKKSDGCKCLLANVPAGFQVRVAVLRGRIVSRRTQMLQLQNHDYNSVTIAEDA